jgi:hypothetical protein
MVSEFEKAGAEVTLRRERDILDSDMKDKDLCIALGKLLISKPFI